ncbi:MAG: M20/M25/M40 family metallo-hydrolase [Flavobacteriales bacterium]
MNFSLLKTLCSIHAPSGSEHVITQFLLAYIKKEKKKWKVQPTIIAGKEFHDAIVLVFGKPKTAMFAHIDSIGYTVGYSSNLIKIGGPASKSGYKLVGEDSQGTIECALHVDKDRNLSYLYKREIDRGTTLTFKPNFRESEDYIQSPYMDNRLGVFTALKTAETLENGIIVFSTYEEHGGGSAQFIAKHIYEKYKVRQALICDITWVTSGVQHGNGVAFSMRDSGIPRRTYLDTIQKILKQSGVMYQVEVESAGGSDGNVLQNCPYPFDWCFIGAPEDNVHSPDEKVAITDIEQMLKTYKVLMQKMNK